MHVVQPFAEYVIVFAYYGIETDERLDAETLSVNYDGNCF